MSTSKEGENAFENVEQASASSAQNNASPAPSLGQNSVAENSLGASPMTNMGNSLNRPESTTTYEEVTHNMNEPSPNLEENTTTLETPTTTIQTPTTTTAEPTITALEEVEEANSPLRNKTKKRRSTKQSEADAGQKQMLELLRGIYAKEFAEIPEKFRPKPKAYVARAAWYKKGDERDKYIQSWILADKDAANARMGVNVGKKRQKEKAEFSNDYVLDTLPSIVSNATNSAEKFKPSTDSLKERAKKAIQKMNEITDRAHDQLMKRIKQPIVRRTANYLFRETRKLTKRLTAEINIQTRHLQQAAKDHIRRESKAAKTSIERKAEANLTAALGRRPAKRMTHRLTRLRNAGKGVAVKNFLNAENKAGRIPKTIRAKWKTSIPENSSPLNTYND